MAKYRKKPVVVEAFQWLKDEVPEWWELASGKFEISVMSGSVFIPTSEGMMEAKPDDFIIKGTENEIYPCKPNIFPNIYELVSENLSSTVQVISDETAFKDDIDTIGKCANCGVEYHIHKETYAKDGLDLGNQAEDEMDLILKYGR